MWPNLANAVGFQLVWLSCVAGAGSGRGWMGPLAVVIFAAFTLGFGGKVRSDLRVLALALPLGFGFDSALAASGWLHYAQPWPSALAAPAWILSLWAGFALTLNHSLAFLRQHPAWSLLLGLIGGPLAYVAAERGFHAVIFQPPMILPLLALALGWAVALPLLFWLDRVISGVTAKGVAA